MTDETKLREGLEAANALIGRLQELVADRLSQKGAFDEARAFYDVVEVLETSPEITKVRAALDDDPYRFGDPSPIAAGDNTG